MTRQLGKTDIYTDARALSVLLGGGNGMIGTPPGVGEGPGIDVTANKVGLGGDSILLYHADLTPVTEYATVALAMADAASGDVVQLPAGANTETITLAAGVTLRGMGRKATILTGQVTGADGVVLADLGIVRTANDASDLFCLIAPASGAMYVQGCELTATQSGAGTAYAIQQSTGAVYLTDVTGTRTTGLFV